MFGRFTVPVERFKGFSDAVFAIAITLLVLKFATPGLPPKASIQQEISLIVNEWPQFLVYGVGFFTIGAMWINHSAQFKYVERITHGMAIANLVLLFFVAFVPVPTAVLQVFGHSRIAVVLYGLTLTAIVLSYFWLHLQVLAANPTAQERWPWLNLVLMGLYPLVTVLGYFNPLAGVIGFAILALVALSPHAASHAAAAGLSSENAGDAPRPAA
ncbi:MAG TPA: TMEM175 family protein [Candidatus Binatus sp.]|nr:TMEM175 family protein [Candidatus Binatus sp.]